MNAKTLFALAGVLALSTAVIAQDKKETKPAETKPAAPAVKPADDKGAKPADTKPTAPATKPDDKTTKPAEPATKPAELKAPAGANTKSIFETAFADKNFSTLTQLLKEADWHNQLSEAGKFTVFAPTDEAFKKVDAKALEALRKDKKALGNVLTFHVIKGAAVAAADAMKMTESVPTVQGTKFKITVKDGKVMVGNSKGMATVTKADIQCSNGVIHVIDGVLMPEDAAAKPAEKKVETPAKKEEGKGGAPTNAPAKDPK